MVLNNVDTKHDDGYSYYNTYNDYYDPRRKECRRSAKPLSHAAGSPTPARAPPIAKSTDLHDALFLSGALRARILGNSAFASR